jgi:predicted ester cyclase
VASPPVNSSSRKAASGFQNSTFEELIAEGQTVAVRWRGQGRHQNGKFAEWTGMGFYRLREGKITDHWANVDQLGLRKQLGLLPK